MKGLGGIRVLEVAGGFGPAWAAKLLADLGADVIRYESGKEHTDKVRSRPHGVHRWINANKRSATRGWAELLTGADIVIHDLGPAAAARLAMSYPELAARNPRLVVCSITPFGMTGPYADLAAEELTVIHACSWGNFTPSAATRHDLPPLKAFGHHATLQTATVAATAALAAFDRAERLGEGEHVDFSVFAAGAKMMEQTPALASFRGEEATRFSVKTTLPWGIYRCRDGLIQVICVEERQWQALVALMGEPEWATLEVFSTHEQRRHNNDLLELHVSRWMASQSVAELYRMGQSSGICVSPVYTMAEMAADSHLRARGFFATAPDGSELPGPGFQTDQGWWALRASAPAPGEHDGEGWRERPAEPAQSPAVSDTSRVTRPLEGVRVCDFTWLWAGPFCTQYLAHLGADVIRLESPEHLCLMRRLPYNPPDMELGPENSGSFHIWNTDKRSVGVDLAHPGAREVIARLVRQSDVVVDNFSAGTMARLGFGIDDLRRVNPEVVVVSLTGYGQTGPRAGYMAYGPAGGAVAGLYAVTGYEDGPPEETGVPIGDPAIGIIAAWATVAALVARRRTGAVARVDVSMVEAVATTMGEAWMAYLASGRSPARLGNRDPVWAPHNCYAAAGDDQWLTIACTDQAQWHGLCQVISPGLADDPRFADAPARKRNEASLDALIAAWTAERDPWAATWVLQDQGVPAFPSLSPLTLWAGDPQLAAIGMLDRLDHPVVGRRTLPGIPWRLANGPNGLRRPAPLLAQHTEEVLTGLLGYSAADVVRLTESGAVYRCARPAHAAPPAGGPANREAGR